MSKGKLAKFADMERFENVFQYPYSVVDDVPFDMKGKWRDMYFHNDNPIVLELGCGKGEYTVELAKLYPEMNFIGVDIKGARMWTGAKKAIEEGQKNVAFLRTNIEIIDRFFAEDEVQEIWLTNCDAKADVTALAKKERSWRQGDYRVTETKEYAVKRLAKVPYRGVPADGSQKIEDALMDAIEPFSYDKMKPFSMKYLSGFMAQKYDVPYDQILPRIHKRIDTHAVKVVERSITGYSSHVVTSHNVQMENIRHDYVLLPVWFMHYQYHGKDYDFAMNGQTGTQAGTPPLSWPKALICSGVIAAAVIGLAILLGGYLFR